MNESRNLLIAKTVVGIGIVAAGTYIRRKDEKRKAARNKSRELYTLVNEHLMWVASVDRNSMSYEDFVKQYNERVEFINIVAES